MSSYYIWTIGCQMNKSESERLAVYLEHFNYQPAPSIEAADLVVLNSCVVREGAENKVVNKLHALKTLKKSRPEIKIVLTGCFVDREVRGIRDDLPFIDYFLPAGEIPSWLGRREPQELLPLQPSTAVYVPIMQGCNNYCSYCIVPYRRGRERSRPPDEILNEIKELVKRGTREVTLLGQNVDSYGHDLADRPDLADLLYLIDQLEGLWRIRFLTNHPKDMKDKLLEAMASLKKICGQLNLPVQAGSDAILKAMRRGYSRSDYLGLIGRVRSRLPGVALSTDLIVGFPGESDAQFEESHSLISEVRFDVVHVAAYSPRPGTAAARDLADDVPETVKKQRLERIEQLQAGIAGEINAALEGTLQEVLVEGREKARWFGRTASDKLVFFSSAEDCQGKLLAIEITRGGPWSLSGRIAS
jgi:tRNA-2-methylthio-N6-dimethylallyladenosine synthase